MASLWEEHEVGDVVTEVAFDVSRDSIVRYAGASGDFNPIHFRDDIAQSVGLEGVLAHGMLTMGLAVSSVTEWLGSKGFVADYQVRFTKPVYVPATGSVTISVSASLARFDEPAEGLATLALSVSTEDGTKVLGKVFLVVSPR